MVSLTQEKIYFGPFQVILDDIIAKNIVKLKFAYVRGYNFISSVTQNQIVLVLLMKIVIV